MLFTTALHLPSKSPDSTLRNVQGRIGCGTRTGISTGPPLPPQLKYSERGLCAVAPKLLLFVSAMYGRASSLLWWDHGQRHATAERNHRTMGCVDPRLTCFRANRFPAQTGQLSVPGRLERRSWPPYGRGNELHWDCPGWSKKVRGKKCAHSSATEILGS